MALIKCPECNKDVSDKAVSCPHCGYPIQNQNSIENDKKTEIYSLFEVTGKILLNCTYKDAILAVCIPYVVVTNIERTEIYAMLSYDRINDLDSICKSPKKPGGFIRDEKKITFFNRRTKDELPEFYIQDKNELKEFRRKEMELILEIKRNPLKFSNVKCPTCGSSNIKKLSTANKVGSAVLFGVFAINHIGKTFKCNSCGMEY